jgi:hypothetical protein
VLQEKLTFLSQALTNTQFENRQLTIDVAVNVYQIVAFVQVFVNVFQFQLWSNASLDNGKYANVLLQGVHPLGRTFLSPIYTAATSLLHTYILLGSLLHK